MNKKKSSPVYYVRLFHFKSLLLLLGAVLLLSWGAMTMFGASQTAASSPDSGRLSYRSISVTGEDTLWSIAKENYSREWGSINAYIKEIKRCNSLASEEINAGGSLVIPVYVTPQIAQKK